MELIVEVVGTTNNVLERQRFSKDRIRVGRGYRNDVILNDPHADVMHAEIEVAEDGTVWLQDLDSVNGTLQRKGRRPIDRAAVVSGDIFTIGRNRLRVLFADHDLPAAVPLRRVESFLLWLGRSPVIAVLFALWALLGYSNAYNLTLADFKWSEFVQAQLRGVVSFLALVAGVYLLSVLFRRGGNFLSHLSVLLFVAVLSELASFILEIGRFNGGDHSYEVTGGLDKLAGYAFALLYLWSVLYLAFNLSLRARTLVSTGLVAVWIAITILPNRDLSERFYRPRFP